jgi:hypothetical protein
MGSMWNT